ncbi:hypothetical protein HK104_005442, partial [Borealophlyctis nickersoniae]
MNTNFHPVANSLLSLLPNLSPVPITPEDTYFSYLQKLISTNATLLNVPLSPSFSPPQTPIPAQPIDRRPAQKPGRPPLPAFFNDP